MLKGVKIDNRWFTCALCGKVYKNSKSLKKKIDGYEYFFDSSNCITIFEKLANMYGHDFKTLSANEQYVYSPKWESIVPREQEFGKMKSKIETIEYETFQVIRDPIQVQELVFKLARSSENEILGLFSTSNAFHRQERMDMIPKLKQMKKNNDKLRIRILTPFDDHIDLVSKRLKDEYDINIMNLDESSRIKSSFLLVDRKFVLYIELKDDTKKTVYDAIGISFYSSIRSTVISFATIFEIMWRQQELYQQLSKFRQRIETYELVNKQLNDTIVDLKYQLNF